MKGWIYVISDGRAEGTAIVGSSWQDPQCMADELNRSGFSSPCLVEYEALVDDPLATARQVHDRLSESHEGWGRYRCPVRQAIDTICQVLGDAVLYQGRRRGAGSDRGRTPGESGQAQPEYGHDPSPNDPPDRLSGPAYGQGRTEHALFVERYAARQITVDLDEFKAGFLYDASDLLPRELVTRQRLLRRLALGLLLLGVAMFFFTPWWAALVVLCAPLWAVPVIQKSGARGVLEAALRDPRIYRVALETKTLVIRPSK